MGFLRQPHIHLTCDQIVSFSSAREPGVLEQFRQAGIDFVLLYVYLASRTYNEVRHGNVLNHRLIKHIAKGLITRCKYSRKFIRACFIHRVDLFVEGFPV